MSEPIYEYGGLRGWREAEIVARERISHQIVDSLQRTLKSVNQGWVFERVDTPIIMPQRCMSANYTRDDAFFLADTMGDNDVMVMRAETTDGSYRMAQHILRTTRTKPPLCVWQLGQSHRRELVDGATAANLRFNSFYQLEFQLIYTKPYEQEMPDGSKKARGTAFNYPKHIQDFLQPLVSKITGLPSRIVASDRLPSYSEETLDIEVLWHAPTKEEAEWKEVCSMSRRTDFPQIPDFKDPLTVFEVAFGACRLTCMSNGDRQQH